MHINKLFLLIPAAAAGLFLSGCSDEPYYGRVANDGPAYYGSGPAEGPGYGDYGGPSDEVDFYYVGGVPYSRFYGPLVFRDNRYYFRHGGALVTYDVGFGRHHSYGHGGTGGGHGGNAGMHGSYANTHGGAPHGGFVNTHGGNGKVHGGPQYHAQGTVPGGRDAHAYHGNVHGPAVRKPQGVPQRAGAVPQKGVPQKKKQQQ